MLRQLALMVLGVVGSCADSNLSMHNSLLRTALPNAPMDASVRLLDALAAISKAEVFICNQAGVTLIHGLQ